MIIMKKLTSLLIGCSLALAGAALAQQPVEQQSPSKGKRPPEKARATQAQPGANVAKPQERPAKQTGATKERRTPNEHGATNEPGAGKGRKTPPKEESATTPAMERDVSGQQVGAPTPGVKQQAEQQKKGMKGHAAEKTSATPAAPAAAAASAAPSVPATGQQNAQANAGAKTKKKPDPQQVQQVK